MFNPTAHPQRTKHVFSVATMLATTTRQRLPVVRNLIEKLPPRMQPLHAGEGCAWEGVVMHGGEVVQLDSHDDKEEEDEEDEEELIDTGSAGIDAWAWRVDEGME